MTAEFQAINRFLQRTEFSGYQSVPLPYGLAVPGNDRRPTADRVFSGGVAGKTVLDVGTHYGYFPYEAMRRGAKRAVGVEANPEWHSVARQVAQFNEGAYSIVHASAEQLRLDEQFDVVLMLNILHHLLDPVSVVLALARLSGGQVVLEFCTPSDPAYLRGGFGAHDRHHVRDRVYGAGPSLLLRLLCHRLPLVAIADRPYHRVFYFSRKAFHNLFVVQHGVFDSVRFVRSPVSAHRLIAFCRVADAGDTEQTAERLAP